MGDNRWAMVKMSEVKTRGDVEVNLSDCALSV